MKKWYENISEYDFEKYITGNNSDNPSQKIDYTFLSRIRNGVYKKNKSVRSLFRLLPAIASVSVLFFLFTFSYQKVTNLKNPLSILSIDDDVYYTRNNTTRLISATTKIRKDDRIFTGKTSECLLELKKRGTVSLKNDTAIRIDSIESKNEHYRVFIEKGITAFTIQKKDGQPFFVTTPLVDIKVVGTQFDVTHKEPSFTTITLTEGVLSITHVITNETIQIHAPKVIQADINGFITDNKVETIEIPETNPIIKTVADFRKIIKNGTEDKNNSILGFVPFRDTLIAQSESDIKLLDKNGSIIWKKVYGKITGIRFMSLPAVFNNTLFISSTDKRLIAIDLKTGNETSQTVMDGAILFGNTILGSSSDAYLPLSRGIYHFSFQENKVALKPFITISEPLSPIISGNNFIITSITGKTIALFSRDGSKQWEYQLADRSIFKAVMYKNAIITSDLHGNMYKLSMSGNILLKTKLPFIITSEPVIDNGVIYVTDENGTFYSINPEDFSIIQNIQIAYNKRNAINQGVFTIFHESIVLSDTLSTLYILNKKDLTIQKRINTTLATPVTKIYYYDKKIFAGSRSGDIEIMGIE